MAGVKGRSGRRKTPTAIRAAAGIHEYALPQNEPKPEPLSSLEPPAYISEKAKRRWHEAAKQLDACGVMTKLDDAALAQYCELFVTWCAAVEHTRKNGVIITDKRSGAVKANPSIATANQAHDRLLKMMLEFGMTPSSRANIKTRAGFKRGASRDEHDAPNRFAVIKGGRK